MSEHQPPRQPKGTPKGGQWRAVVKPESDINLGAQVQGHRQRTKVVPGGQLEAENHLRKATEYLSAAKRSLEEEQYDAAVGLAAIAGINSADAICLWAQGVRSASASHTSAINLLRASHVGADVPGDLAQLLSIKNVAQYSEAEMSNEHARQSIQAAQRILAVAQKMVKPVENRAQRTKQRSTRRLVQKILGEDQG
jgi:uncharacterized protein (UPF0332 family)